MAIFAATHIDNLSDLHARCVNVVERCIIMRAPFTPNQHSTTLATPGAERSDALLLDIYSCAAMPSRWAPVLDQLCIETGAHSAFVQALRVEGVGMHQYWSAQDTHSCRFILPRLGPLADGANPRLDIRYRQRGVDRFVRDEDLFGPEIPSLRGYRERLAAIGMGRFIGTMWQLDADKYIALALHRKVGDASDFSSEQIGWLTTYFPHISQAASLTQKFEEINRFNHCLRSHLDCLRCGMLICKKDGHVMWANRSAERLLESNRFLRLHAGTLLGRSMPATHALMRELANVAATFESSHLALGQQPQVLHVALHPLADCSDQYFDSSSVLLILTTPEMNAAVSSKVIAQLFALTPAESRLASALVGGLTVEQYALRQGVSTGTARGQLKQVLHKTGTARQAELVRMILSSAGAQVVIGE